MFDAEAVVALLYVAAYVYLSVKCVRDGILPNRVVYPLALLSVVARPDGIGLLPLDHFIAGAVVLLLAYFAYTRGVVNAGLAKIAAVVALASAPQVGLPALAATWVFCIAVGQMLLALRLARRDQSLRYGAFFPLAGIHSVLWIFFPLSVVLVGDVVTYGAMLVATFVGVRATSRIGPQPNAIVSRPFKVAEIAEQPSGEPEEPAFGRIGELVPIPKGALLFRAPDVAEATGPAADGTGLAVVRAMRGPWLQVRDNAGNVGWLAPNQRTRIVIVDDIDEIRENLGKLISFETDMRVVGLAMDGEEGVKTVQALQPDIVLMDINMPVMDGITATEILTRTSPKSRVIMISVQDSQDYIRRSKLAGAKEYLVEPFTADDLVATIRRVASAK